MNKEQLKNNIQKLKHERNAVIVAHNYQIEEVQDIADIVGDSYFLSKFCAENDFSTIVFCGVHFMAESAKILSPNKTVLLPEIQAGCPMANMVTGDQIKKMKVKHPNAVSICYVNTTAETKAECDICCTSSNAVKIVKSLEEKDILFFPDKNLGNYISKQVPEKNIILWDGYCNSHNRIELSELHKAKELCPNAIVTIHPESRPELVAEGDFVGSTSQIIDFCKKSDAKEFIIGTEMGILHKLKQDNPNKIFHLISPRLICPNMKLTTLESIYRALDENRFNIEVKENIRIKAEKSLKRMIEIASK